MKKKGTKTMLMSVIMSAPGPLILGVGLLLGRSNTQTADFIRRSIELLAIILSFVVYKITTEKQLDEKKALRLERNTNIFVGAMMLLAGAIMLCITLFGKSESEGNVLFGLIIAFMGAVANTVFWFRYRYLAKAESNSILEVQSRLYRAKSFVDMCVVAALLTVLIAPDSDVSYYFDLVGSSVVSVYLGYSGAKIIIQLLKKAKPPTEIGCNQ